MPGLVGQYLLVLGAEALPVQLVDGHHDGHHVFAVHDGDGQDVLCLILRQLINKAAEMRTLRRQDTISAAPPGQQGAAAGSATGARGGNPQEQGAF